MIRKALLSILLLLIALPCFAEDADSIWRVGGCKVGYSPRSLMVQSDYLYLADDEGFKILDVSIPSNPYIRSILNDLATYRTKSIFVKDTIAYIRGGSSIFAIVNVADVDSPVRIGYTGGLPVGGALYPKGIFVYDTIAFLANNDKGVMICNVKDLTAPFLVDSFPSHIAINLTMQDSILFIADYDSLLIVNAKDPLNLSQISAIPIPEKAYDVFVKDNYAYVTGRSSLGIDGKVKIVDFSNLQSPEVIGEILWIRGDPIAVFVTDKFVYVAAEDWWEPKKEKTGKADVEGGVRVAFADPESTSLSVSYDTPGSPKGIWVVGDLIFVTDNDLISDNDSVLILKHKGAGVEEETDVGNQIPDIKHQILKVYPNPFNSKTTVFYTLDKSINVSIIISDITGRIIEKLDLGYKHAGSYSFQIPVKLPSGTYFYTLKTKEYAVTRKMVIVN